MNELWRDYSAHQDDANTAREINPQVAIDNGVVGFIFRSGTSWTYKDPTFNYLWDKVAGKAYRTSYHNFSAGADVDAQMNNWFEQQPVIETVPRFAAVEGNYNNLEPYQIASEFFHFSNRYLEREGQRPGIYTRKQLADLWLTPFLDEDWLNEHWWWIAQYDASRSTEQLDRAIIPPNGVLLERCWLKQTADLMPGFVGEAESGSVDRDRFQFENMDEWIHDNFVPVPSPPVDCCEELLTTINEWSSAILDNAEKSLNNATAITELRSLVNTANVGVAELAKRIDKQNARLDEAFIDITTQAQVIEDMNARLDELELEVEGVHKTNVNQAGRILKLENKTIPETNHSHWWQRWFK